MVMRSGIKPLVEVVSIGVNPYSKQQMVVISLLDIHLLTGMVHMMYGSLRQILKGILSNLITYTNVLEQPLLI